MWLGEQITKRGIGNGISILIFASILTGLPLGITAWWNGGPMERIFFPLIALAIVACGRLRPGGPAPDPDPVREADGRPPHDLRRLDLPAAAREHGGRDPGHLRRGDPRLPADDRAVLPRDRRTSSTTYFQPGDWLYLMIEGAMIVVFAFFYTAVQFNPVDQADNLRKHGGYIPGIRPGPPTAQYLDRVLTRLTLPGSLFLATVAVAPSLFIRYGGFSQASAGALGGTSVLIAVGVALDTMRQMESQMMMRNYEGFLRREPSRSGPPGLRQGNAGKADRGGPRNPARLDRRHVPRRDRRRGRSSVARWSRSSRAESSSPTSSRRADPRAALAARRDTRIHSRRVPAEPRPGRGARRDARGDRPRRSTPILFFDLSDDPGARAPSPPRGGGRPRGRHARGDRAGALRSTTSRRSRSSSSTARPASSSRVHAERSIDEVASEIADTLDVLEGAAA